MPRGSKRHANQHNSRHENGVVAPGKRVNKQKSNGHLNGQADGKARDNTPPLPSPALSPPTAAQSFRPNNLSVGTAKGSPINGTREQNKATASASATANEVEDLDSPNYGRSGEQYNRRMEPGSPRLGSGQEAGFIHLALTVLKSCPLRDTLAILIFLLSLPPTFLSLTNAVFALITFVPPSGSFTNFPSLADITSSFSPGAPSFIVMLLIDIIAWVLLGFLTPPLQDIFLDYAQAMIATTLGGGYTHRPGTSDNTLHCVAVVSATHVARHRKFVLRQLHRTWLAKWLPIMDTVNDSYRDETYSFEQGRPSWHTVEVVIALHIVCQGFTRMMRRILYTSQNSTSISSARNPDPEAAGSQSTSEAGESTHNGPPTPLGLRSLSSLQNLREGNRISSGKRRRKQSNYVRSHQPLWAAFASTKATIMREYEQTQATTDAKRSDATDGQNLGDAPFSEESRIWITNVHPLGLFFETGPLTHGKCRKGTNVANDSGTDRSKPFFLRVNGADWASVKIAAIPNSEDDQGRPRWTGEVYCLSPSNAYQVSFNGFEDRAVLYSEILSTPAAPIAEDVASPTTTAPQTLQPASPASPIATLKSSVRAFESGIGELSTQQRRIKKDGKAASLALRKEIDALIEKISRHSNNEKGLQSRQMQQSQHMKQADDAIDMINEELESFSTIPEDDSKTRKELKASWETLRNELARAQEGLIRTRDQNKRDYTSAQSDVLSAKQRLERLQRRAAGLSNQYKRLTTFAVAEKGRSNSEHFIRIAERLQIENRYIQQNSLLERNFKELTYWTNNAHARCAQLEEAARQVALAKQNQSRLQHESRPMTPEGILPGTNPMAPTNAVAFNRNAFYGTPESQYISMANGHETGNANTHPWDGRARSTSMLSGDSVYEDFDDDDDFIPPMPKRRSGMGSVRESGEGGSSGGASPHNKHPSKASPGFG